MQNFVGYAIWPEYVELDIKDYYFGETFLTIIDCLLQAALK